MNTLVFNPATGFKDTSVYTDPTNETEAREQLMSLHSQTQTYINDELVPAVEAALAAGGDPEAIADIMEAIAGKADSNNAELTGTATLNGEAIVTESTIDTFTLSPSSWVDNAYNITDARITATSNQEVLPPLGVTSEQLQVLQAANLVDGGQIAGRLTLIAMGDVPTSSVTIRIIFRGNK